MTRPAGTRRDLNLDPLAFLLDTVERLRDELESRCLVDPEGPTADDRAAIQQAELVLGTVFSGQVVVRRPGPMRASAGPRMVGTLNLKEGVTYRGPGPGGQEQHRLIELMHRSTPSPGATDRSGHMVRYLVIAGGEKRRRWSSADRFAGWTTGEVDQGQNPGSGVKGG